MRVIRPLLESTMHGPPLSGPISENETIFCSSGRNLLSFIRCLQLLFRRKTALILCFISIKSQDINIFYTIIIYIYIITLCKISVKAFSIGFCIDVINLLLYIDNNKYLNILRDYEYAIYCEYSIFNGEVFSFNDF